MLMALFCLRQKNWMNHLVPYFQTMTCCSNWQLVKKLSFATLEFSLYTYHSQKLILHTVSSISRNATKPSLVAVSLSMRVDPTVRCTTTPAAALCAIAVKSPSQADVSLLCIVNFTRSTLCAPSASNSSTKALSRNRMISLTVIPASLNSLGRRVIFFLKMVASGNSIPCNSGGFVCFSNQFNFNSLKVFVYCFQILKNMFGNGKLTFFTLTQ